MKKFLPGFLLLLAGMFAQAQSLTWSSDIAPILYNNCTSCHHQGGLAPFSLIDYTNAFNQRFNIQADVEAKVMPPWPPDAHYRRLAHERILSQSDINKISAWVSSGAAMGDTANTPVPPVYTNGSQLGTVDLSVVIPTFTVPGTTSGDLYQCFSIPSGLLQGRHITGFEVLPGNPEIVHHVLVYQDTSGECAQLDANTPGPGYVHFGTVGSDKAILIGGWVPGSQPQNLPAGMGIQFYANSDIVIQVHYPAGSGNKTDSTRINFKLTSNTVRDVYTQPALNHLFNLTNGPFHIAPNEVKTFQEHYKTPNIAISALSVAPHCHLIGKKWLSFGITPQGDTIPLIKIDNWDFHWQGFYEFRNLMKIPGNTDLYAYCTYDNTTDNPDNPNNPPQHIYLGESTTDEMMLIYFSYLLYYPNDENIAIDNTPLVNIDETTTAIAPTAGIVATAQLYNAEPNPANNQTTFNYYLPDNTAVELKIFDLQGRLIDNIKAPNAPGFNSVKYNTAGLMPGTYIYSLSANGQVKSKQLIIAR